MKRMMLMVLLAAGCQAPMQSGSQCVVTPGYVAGIEYFQWKSDPAVDLIDQTGYVGPIAVQALEEAVTSELVGKGFREAAATADENTMQVALTLRTRRELSSYEGGERLCETNDCWERIDMGSQVRMEVRTVGFLAADVYHQGEPIWRGWVETYLYPKDRDQADAIIAKAVPRLFETFPP